MSVFSFLTAKSETTNQTKTTVSRPAKQYTIDNMVANMTLCDQLYHNAYPGLKLSGGLAYNPIAIPVWYMGQPIVRAAKDNTKLQEAADLLMKQMSQRITQNHVICHRRGTSWIWPRYDSVGGRVYWDDIPDDQVTDILRDPATNEISEIWRVREMDVATGFEETKTITEKTRYTLDEIAVTYTGPAVAGYEDIIMDNPIGILPVNFANNTDPGEARGYSDYERILQGLKQYHDIDLAESELLAKFRAKMIQAVTNVDEWITQNGMSDIGELDPGPMDLVLNLPEETTEYLFPKDAVDGYEAALKRIFRKMVESCGVPEIAWGLKTEGNMASVEENMAVLSHFAMGKQSEKTDKYRILIAASLRLMMRAGMSRDPVDIVVTWNEISALNEQQKAAVFQQYMDGLGKVMNVAGMTKQQLHKFWLMRFPDGTPEEYDEFNAQLLKAGGYRAFSQASYAEQLAGNGRVDEDEII